MRDPEATRSPGGQLQLGAFVPRLVHRRLAVLTPTPGVEQFQAAIMVADCSGFSLLTERLAERKRPGAEELKDLLNRLFGPIIHEVEISGGQVVAFPGDAVVALWPHAPDSGIDPASCAVQCALAVQRQLAAHVGGGNVQLRLRAGVGTGEIWAAHVGGVSDCWHLVVGGDSLQQAIRGVAAAAPGEVVVSPSAWRDVGTRATGQAAGHGMVRVQQSTPVSVAAASPVSGDPIADALLRRYVPRAVQTRMDAGQTEWLAEFRHASIAFIDIGQVDCTSRDGFDHLQRAVATMQRSLERYGGSINQVVVDDKGTIVACGWGLALHAHADDAVRAARAVLDIQQELHDDGVTSSVGVATGDVFTGIRGTVERCDYAMIGPAVNRAARLMQAADGDVLCDVSFVDEAGDRVEFEAHDSVMVKGSERAADVYRLRAIAEGTRIDIVGRTHEQQVLSARLDALVRDGQGGVTVIEGDAGMGKSHLLTALVDRAGARGVRCIIATGDAIERSAAYHVWRHLYRTVLRLGPESRGELRVRALLQNHERLWPFAPLLNPVLGLSFDEDERSRSVPPRGRALITRDLLVELFKRAVGDEPTLVVLDDTHWFDSASWAVAEGIQRELPGVMMVIAQRPLPADEKSPEQLRLSATPDAQMLRLEPLSPDATRQLVCLRLRARVLEPDVERLFLQKAEGHPFFTEELAHALRDRGLVRVEQGVCRFTGAGAQGESTLLPNTVQVMVSSRIDQLPIPQQLTIKIASIFGQPFDLATLRAIHPAARDDDTLLAECQALADTNLLRNVAAAAPTYAFKHALIQEVAYELLPYAQRRQLHARVAAWYEQNDVPAGGASVLAYHWSRAEVADRALFYLDKAADDALNRFANEEAERFYAAALAMDATRGADAGAQEAVRLSGKAISARDSRRVRWHRRCGDASANLGRWAEARTQFERALMLVGERSTNTHWAVGIAGELTTQCVHRLTPRLVRRCPPGAADLQRETVRAYERMGAISYLMEQTPSLFQSLLAALNRAEELGTDADTALVYADVGNIAGMIPVHRLARRYNGMARAAAARLGESPLLARVLGRASVYRVAIGDWNTCDDLARSMEMCDELGDPYQWEESAAIRARAAHLRGEFQLAVTLGSEIRRRARDNSSSAHEVWGLDAEAWGLWYLGGHQRALDLANRGLAMMADAKRPDRVPMLDLLGVVALARLSANDVEGARAAARQAADALDAVPRPGHMATIGISAVVEACVALWELEPSNGDAQATANTALGHLKRYVRLNPTSLPRVHLWQGCVEWLKGRHRSAHREWQHCIDESQRLQQPYEEARARYEIGRRCDVGDVTREEHLLVAERIFDRLGVEFERRRVVAARAAAESLAP